MGIREEVEKCIKEVRDAGPALEDWEHHKRYADEVVGVHDGTIHGLGLALSILDEHLGECVAEFPLDLELSQSKHLTGQFTDEETSIAIITGQHKFKLGDHITIYRRKKR